jgi:hypothetical protein
MLGRITYDSTSPMAYSIKWSPGLDSRTPPDSPRADLKKTAMITVET